MFEPDEIKRLIEGALPGATARVVDDAGDKEHFFAEVVAPQFQGKGLVQQHQLVYKSLGSRMGNEIHALQLKTYTPEQWAKKEGS